MPCAIRIEAAPVPDVQGAIKAVQAELVSARAKYPDDSTAAGKQISTTLIDSYNSWVARAPADAGRLSSDYAKWSQEGAMLLNAIRDIEGYAEQGTFSWVLKETAKQSAVDAGNLAAKGGQALIDTAKTVFEWKWPILIGAGALALFFYFGKER
jgi:hypothetical protein